MKRKKDYTIETILFCLLLAVLGSFVGSCSDNVKHPVNVEYFKQGQILLPDYCCPDAMIVRDAAGLNKAIAYIEQYNDTLVETDGEIDSLFHVYCDYYIGSFEDQCKKLKALNPAWDSLQIATAINED